MRERMKFHVSLTPSLDGGGLSASFHCPYSPGKVVMVTAEYEDGWTPELIPTHWWGEKSLPLLGTESRSCMPIVTDLRGKLPKSISLDHQILFFCFAAKKFYE
jgi:hypothetical protein